MSSLSGIGLHSRHLSIQCSTFGICWNKRFPLWMCSHQTYSMLSFQYGPKTLRNASSTLLTLCHEEWTDSGRCPSTSKVYLVKCPLNVWSWWQLNRFTINQQALLFFIFFDKLVITFCPSLTCNLYAFGSVLAWHIHLFTVNTYLTVLYMYALRNHTYTLNKHWHYVGNTWGCLQSVDPPFLIQ